jgi:hypothetical protein
MRTFAFGEVVGQLRGMRYDRELFYIASVLHDLGLSNIATGGQRFEVEGADAAQEFLSREGMSDADIDIVWDAIALHTTVGIAQRKRPELALVQAGAGVDLGFVPLGMIEGSELDRVITEWPRLEFKTQFPTLFVELFRRNPAAVASPVTAEVCAHLVPGFPASPHICDVVAGAGFRE